MVSNEFEEFGGSYLISDENYEKYINGASDIGRPDGQFMTPSNQMDDLLANHPNDPREWERQLGLGEKSLGDSNIHRVDVYNPQDYEPRLPTSDLSGANDKFIPGGKTPGGQDECVINQFPNPEKNPSVGKISEVGQEQAEGKGNYTNDTQSHSSTDKISDGGGSHAPPAHKKSGTLPTQTADPKTTNQTLNPKQEGDNFSQKNGQPPDPKQSNTDDLYNKKASNTETNGTKPDQTNGQESPQNTEASKKNGTKPDQVSGKESPQNVNAPEQSGAKPDHVNQSGNEDNFKKAEPDASNTKAMDASPSNQPVANAPAETAPTPTPAPAPKNAMGM